MCLQDKGIVKQDKGIVKQEGNTLRDVTILLLVEFQSLMK